MNAPPIEKRKLRTHEYVVAGVPMVLMALGGAVGGAVGGAAFAINVAIFRKEWAPAKKYLVSVLVTLASGAVYVAVIVILAMIFPHLFKR